MRIASRPNSVAGVVVHPTVTDSSRKRYVETAPSKPGVESMSGGNPGRRGGALWFAEFWAAKDGGHQNDQGQDAQEYLHLPVLRRISSAGVSRVGIDFVSGLSTLRQPNFGPSGVSRELLQTIFPSVTCIAGLPSYSLWAKFGDHRRQFAVGTWLCGRLGPGLCGNAHDL